MTDSLFIRLGEEQGIRKISSDVVDFHKENMLIKARFNGTDTNKLKDTVAKFFISGSGGPQVYDGKDMRTAHQHMNISDNEFMSAVDDVMKALDNNNIGEKEKAEILYIFYSLRPDVVGV